MHAPAILTPRKSLILPPSGIAPRWSNRLPAGRRRPVQRASFISPGNPNPHRGFNYLSGDLGGDSDPFFAFVRSLMHFDLAPGLLADSSANAFAYTQNNPARPASLGNPKFGTNSIDCTTAVPVDLSGILSPLSTQFADQNTPWPITLEFWFRCVTAPPTFAIECMFWERADTTSNTRFVLNPSGTTTGLTRGAAVTYSAVSVVDSLWHFYATTVDNAQQARTYFDGVKVSDTTAAVADQPGVAKRLTIGRANAIGTGVGSWQFDDVRFTLGGSQARYTGATCPIPTAAFPNS